MESSFFEYRDQTGVESDSDTDIIEESLIEELIPKTPLRTNHTVVPDSEESMVYDCSDEEKDTPQAPKTVVRQSIADDRVVCSSDDDASRQASRQSENMSYHDAAVSSDEEEEVSPEMIPKRRPPLRQKSLNSTTDSPILRRVKKRMVLIDSDTDNSIIIEKNKNSKMKCLKDTPLKIDSGKGGKVNESEEEVESDASHDESEASGDESEAMCDESVSDDISESIDDESKAKGDEVRAKGKSKTRDNEIESSDNGSKAKSDRSRAKAGKYKAKANESKGDDESESSDDEIDESRANGPKSKAKANESKGDDESKAKGLKYKAKANESESSDDEIDESKAKGPKSKAKANESKGDDESESSDDEPKDAEADSEESLTDDGPDEDQMVMSRATRMSIMGIIPKQNDSDESDFIESDDSVKSSIAGSTESLQDLPEVTLLGRTPLKVKTPEKLVTRVETLEDDENDDSVLTCSPIQSPVARNDNVRSPVLNRISPSIGKALKERVLNNLIVNDMKKETKYYDGEVTVLEDGPKLFKKPNSYYDGEVTVVEDGLKETVVRREEDKENVCDDDVAVIDSVPEVITLSSDEEDEINAPNKLSNKKTSPKPKLDVQNAQKSSKVSPKPKLDVENVQKSSKISPKLKVDLQAKPKTTKSSPKPKVDRKDGTIRQYLPPPSYPNQVVYVKKHVLDNELSKLNSMQADLHNIRHLLDNMDVTTLPDGGSKLLARLSELEAEVRRQGDAVGNMVVEPSQPTAADVARDGFDQGLSWDDLQKASNAVQPRMFGKQAMSTHLAERNLILERLRDLHESLDSRPPEEKMAAPPAALKTELMPHQRHALAWLRWRETQNPPGGILADDMGLGKTITMISLIASDKEVRHNDSDDEDDERPKGKSTKGGTLVVCPASLMTQWEGEVKKHCLPHRVTTCLHHGAARATQPQRLAHHDIVLTTYNILQRDSEKDGVLMRVQWRRAILDEAHCVRNHKSATSRAVCTLRARRRWALTGTPLHNKDLDLFALLKFLRCSPFDDLAMWKKWIDNKSQGGQERLSTVMRCIMLRRTKTQLQAKGQLKDLPPRTSHQTLVTLTKEEMNVYQKVLVFSKTLFAQFLHQRAEKQADGAFMPGKKNAAYDEMHKKMIALQGAKPVKSHEILVLLLRLRQVCCHCGLIAAMLDENEADVVDEDEGGKDLLAELNKLSLEDSKSRRKSGEKEKDPEEREPEQEGTTAAEAIRSVLSPNNPVFELTNRSSKIQAVMDCLKENVLGNKGEKAVVVSQWTSVLSLVEQELRRAGVRCVTLSGGVAVPARAALVDALNDPRSDVRVMLLSLCAGGVGLNLCGASHLLLLDPHWNPQLEEQAQDRVYRVGQTRPVHIYRFMCVDTVEQSIRKLQEAKLEMAANVLTGARHTNASKLSIEDLKVLFNMGQ